MRGEEFSRISTISSIIIQISKCFIAFSRVPDELHFDASMQFLTLELRELTVSEERAVVSKCGNFTKLARPTFILTFSIPFFLSVHSSFNNVSNRLPWLQCS